MIHYIIFKLNYDRTKSLLNRTTISLLELTKISVLALKFQPFSNALKNFKMFLNF